VRIAFALAVWLSIVPQEAPWRAGNVASFEDVWQTVADTFYDPTFSGLDWTAVRDEFRPRVAAATSAGDIRRLTTEMLARLMRSHFVLLSASDAGDDYPMGAASVGIDVRVSESGLLVTRVRAGSGAEAAGVRAGDLMLGVDATDMREWRLAGSSAADRHQALQLWRKARRALHGSTASRALLRLKSPGGDERAIRAPREIEPGETVTLGNLPPMNVRTAAREWRTRGGRRAGAIEFNIWMTAIDAPVAAAIDRFRDADGLVIDLRGNPGGLAAMMSGIAGHLVDDANALLGRMQTRQAQLEFRPNPRLVTADGRRVRPFSGRVAILVDELTGSTSECFAAGLQGLDRARIFGRQTMGQALPALTKRLANGDVFMYAIGNFVTAKGRSVEGEGVIPDERVALSAGALAAGRDADLEAALAWIDR
jgi:carboxyl-terminal processing protease